MQANVRMKDQRIATAEEREKQIEDGSRADMPAVNWAGNPPHPPIVKYWQYIMIYIYIYICICISIYVYTAMGSI